MGVSWVWRILLLLAAAASTVLAPAQLANSPWPKYHGTADNRSQSLAYGATSTVKWAYTGTYAFFAAPVIGPDGTVYEASEGDGLLAIDGTTGALKWTFAANNLNRSTAAVGTDGTVYVATPWGYFYALNGKDGSIKWQLKSSGGEGFSASPAIGADGTVYVGCSDQNLYALNPASGAVDWSYKTGSQILTCPAIAPDGTIYVASTDKKLYAFTTAGAVKWMYSNSNGIGTASVGVDGTVYASVGSSAIVAINPANGKALWTCQTGIYPASPPAIGPDGTIYTVTSFGLYAIDGASGALKWTHSPGAAGGDVAVGADSTVYFGSNDDNVYAIDGLTGSEKWHFKAKNLFGAAPAIGADGTLYIGCYDKNFYAFQSSLQSPSVEALTLNPSTIVGGNPSTATVTLTNSLPYGEAVVTLASDTADAGVPVLITVPPGKKSTTFQVTTKGVSAQKVANITATLNTSKTAALTLTTASVASVTPTPTSVVGGNVLRATIHLDGYAGNGGAAVQVTSDNPAATVPATVTIDGQTGIGFFDIATVGVDAQTTATITCTLGDSQSMTLKITPAALASVTFNPSPVTGGNTSIGTVTLNGQAGPSGTVVSLSSNNAAVSVPATVNVGAGQSSATFIASTTKVSAPVTATITGVCGATKTVLLTVNPPEVASLTLNPYSVVGGIASTGIVTLASPAGTGGVVVALSSSDPAATVSNTVTIAEGASGGTFSISTSAVATSVSATITATYGTSKSATLTISPPSVAQVIVLPSSVVGGNNATGSVLLDGPAPGGGAVVALSSSSNVASTPASVTVPAGQNSASFTIATKAVTLLTTVQITATFNKTKSVNLQVAPISLMSVSLSPNSVVGGASVSGLVVLTGGATGKGVVVNLSSTDPAATVPLTVTVPAGQGQVYFTVKTSSVSSQKIATVWAVLGTDRKSDTLTINPLTLVSVAVAPATLAGGSSSQGVVLLNGPAPTGGLVVKLSSSNTAAKVPVSVKILAGKTTASFTATTVAVSTQQVATITAKLGTISCTTTLTVNPPNLVSITVSPATVNAGASATGTAALSSPAPSGGLAVKLQSSLSSVTTPASVVVPAGRTSATFTIKTTKAASGSTATIAGTLPTGTKTAQLQVK